jgi:hypothetical protein
MSANFSAPRSAERGAAALDVPRLPVLGWDSFAGPKRSAMPCILDNPEVRFTTSGRAAIGLALRALGVGLGDRVLVPTYHCPTMIAPVVAAGAEPIFFPIEASGAPLLKALEAIDTSGVRAMVAAHYFGLPQSMAALRSFCDGRGVALIEDCAHSLFGTADGRPVGQWGDYAIASLTKFLPVVDGGCLVSRGGLEQVPRLRSQPLANQAKSLANALELGARHHRLRGLDFALTRAFALAQSLRSRRAPNGNADLRDDAENGSAHDWLGDFNPQTTLGCTSTIWTRWCARHVHRERIVALRRRNYAHLARLTTGIAGMRPMQPALPDDAAPYVFPLWVERPEATYQAVRAAGIPVFRWDETWPTRPTMPNDSGRIWATHVFQLGCHQDLRPEDLVLMADALVRIVTRKSPSSEKVPVEP